MSVHCELRYRATCAVPESWRRPRNACTLIAASPSTAACEIAIELRTRDENPASVPIAAQPPRGEQVVDPLSGAAHSFSGFFDGQIRRLRTTRKPLSWQLLDDSRGKTVDNELNQLRGDGNKKVVAAARGAWFTA